MKTGLYIYCFVNILFNLMITNHLVTLLRPSECAGMFVMILLRPIGALSPNLFINWSSLLISPLWAGVFIDRSILSSMLIDQLWCLLNCLGSSLIDLPEC